MSETNYKLGPDNTKAVRDIVASVLRDVDEGKPRWVASAQVVMEDLIGSPGRDFVQVVITIDRPKPLLPWWVRVGNGGTWADAAPYGGPPPKSVKEYGPYAAMTPQDAIAMYYKEKAK